MLKSILVVSCFVVACHGNSGSGGKKPVIVRLPSRQASFAPSGDAVSRAAHTGYSYDLAKPDHSWQLPAGLTEVSGNTWVDPSHLIVIEDLDGKLFLLKIGDHSVNLEKTVTFQKAKGKLDIEDVTLEDSTVYALWSHGVLYRIEDWNSSHPQVTSLPTSLSKHNNTEGLCYDPVTHTLLIACKGDPGIPGAKKSTRAVYQFDTRAKKLYRNPLLVIKKGDFKKFNGDDVHFNPSAIAVHPVTHNLYLLSTRDSKCMAVFDRNGKLIAFSPINADLMPQPEGICFSPDGKLYISSEGKKNENGRLYEFDPH